jgi:hypothetical protein
MATPKTPARLIAEEVCSKFKDAPSLTLAKKLFAEYPEVYKDEEHARELENFDTISIAEQREATK